MSPILITTVENVLTGKEPLSMQTMERVNFLPILITTFENVSTGKEPLSMQTMKRVNFFITTVENVSTEGTSVWEPAVKFNAMI